MGNVVGAACRQGGMLVNGLYSKAWNALVGGSKSMGGVNAL